jgi:hypothetical protein
VDETAHRIREFLCPLFDELDDTGERLQEDMRLK